MSSARRLTSSWRISFGILVNTGFTSPIGKSSFTESYVFCIPPSTSEGVIDTVGRTGGVVQQKKKVAKGCCVDDWQILQGEVLPCGIRHPCRQERLAPVWKLYRVMDLSQEMLAAVRDDALPEKRVVTVPHHHWYMGRMLPDRPG